MLMVGSKPANHQLEYTAPWLFFDPLIPRMRRPSLSFDLILALADFHRRCTGNWPSVKSRSIRGARGDNWRSVDNALRYGLRSLPGGTSLALFLAERRGARNKTNLPRLTITSILTWADAHFKRERAWPHLESGRIVDDPAETWSAVDQALKAGSRGLRGGESLAQLLVRRRGARNHTNIKRLTIKNILAWADIHHKRSGFWPNPRTGAVIGRDGETWVAVETALRLGLRGLNGGTSLYRLLKNHRSIPDTRPVIRRLRIKSKGRGRPGIRLVFPQELLRQYRLCELSAQTIAKTFQVSVSTVVRELRQAGAPSFRPGPRNGPRPALHKLILGGYRQGLSINAVAQAVNSTPQRVTTILKRYGVTRRPAGPDLARHNMTIADRNRLAKRLESTRKAAGMTQKQLEERSGNSQVTVSALENAMQSPTRRTLRRVAKALRIRWVRLLI